MQVTKLDTLIALIQWRIDEDIPLKDAYNTVVRNFREGVTNDERQQLLAYFAPTSTPTVATDITAFYTYASLTTPNHVDISIIVDMLLTIITVERISVHPQTVNVTALTLRESAKLSMMDMPITNDANLLSTPLPQGT